MRTNKQSLRKHKEKPAAETIFPTLKKSGVLFETLKKLVVPALLLPIAMIWRYLDLIGWPSLVWETLSNSNALLGTLLMGLLLSFVLLSTAVLPSIVLYPLRTLFIAKTTLPKSVRKFPFSLFLAWIFFFGLNVFQVIPDSTWFITLPTVIIGALYLAWFRKPFASSFDPCFAESWKTLLGAFAILLCVGSLACLASTFPMMFALKYMEVSDQDPYALWSGCAILVLIAGSSFLPGQILLFGKQSLTDRIAGVVGTVTIVAMLWILILPHTLDVLTWMTLRASGIYVEEKTPIILQTSKAKEDARKINLVEKSVDINSVILPFIRFKFGETVLLCSDEYAPLKTKVKSKSDYPVPTGSCAVFNKNEIRQLVM